MASQGFFLILFLIIAGFALWYYFSMKSRKNSESMLNVDGGPRDLKKELKFWSDKVQDTSFQTREVQDLAKSLKAEINHARAKTDTSKSAFTDKQGSSSFMTVKPVNDDSAELMGAKSLNVHFVYNGHTWDAYEVLGVPAGSSLRSVTQNYQASLMKADPQSRSFLDAAYQAILKKV